MKTLIVFIGYLAVTLGASNLRIVGGQNASIEDYPYQVSLLHNEKHTCGGSIIGTKWIVTAARCTDGLIPSNLTIRAGSSLLDFDYGQVVPVIEISQHPQYNRANSDYDISILELSTDITIDNAKPIALPQNNTEIVAGTISTITGWGAREDGGAFSLQLQVVDLPITSKAQCRAIYGGAEHVTDRMLCAESEGGKSACQGDTGGPLVINDELIGIFIWEYGCGLPIYPGLYTSVPVLRSFITEITGL